MGGKEKENCAAITEENVKSAIGVVSDSDDRLIVIK